jgi:FixJ family two-component response regulator
MKNRSATVVIVDDDPSVLLALSRLLRSAGWNTATFASPDEFLSRYDLAQPGCLLLDVAMPGLNGLQLQLRLSERGCLLPIIFLTGRGNIPTSVRAMKAGAIDFLTKPVRDKALLEAIQVAVEKDRLARRARAEAASIAGRLGALTPREQEVLRHVIAGRLNKQIASDLGTTEQTIKVHRARVMEKMGVGSVAELVRVTERAGFRPTRPRD